MIGLGLDLKLSGGGASGGVPLFSDVLAQYDLTLPENGTASIVINADTTESVGSSIVTNGGFENWTGGDPDDWSEEPNATTDEESGAGAYGGSGSSLKITSVVAANQVYQNMVSVGSTVYRLQFAYKNGAGDVGQWDLYDVSNGAWIKNITDLSDSTSWSSPFTYEFTTPAGCEIVQVGFRGKSDGDILWVDGVMLRPVTNPAQNKITCTISRATNRCTLSKTVAGTTTVLFDEAFTYSAGTNLIIVKDPNNKVNVFYNGVRVGTEQTVSDATVIYNKRHYVEGDGSGAFSVERFRLGGNALTGFSNDETYDYETFTSSGANITQAVNSVGYGICHSNALSLTGGVVYAVNFTMNKSSGTAPLARAAKTDPTLGNFLILSTGAVPDGSQTYYIMPASTGTHYFGFRVGDGVATDFSVSAATIKPVNP